MNRRARLMVLSILGTVSVCLAMAALAWACTPQAFISLSPSSGPPGTAVTVSGHGFVAGGRVDIRMGAVNGAPIATATGATFAVTVTIPQSAAAGYQLLGAIGYDTAGQAQGSAAQTFLVHSDAVAAPKATQPGVRSPQQQNPPSPVRGHGHAPSAVRPHHTTPAARSAPATVLFSAPAVANPTTPATVVRPAASQPAAALPQAPVDQAVHAAPQHRLGLAPVPAAHVPSHADSWPAAASGQTDTSSGSAWNQLTVGIGLLAIGLVALFGGFAVAELRRRRAPVRARR